MFTRIAICFVLFVPIIALPMTSCESLPGNTETQSAVIGGIGGAALGALIAEDNRLLGGLIGAALGAGGGYLIGTHIENVREDDRESAREAARNASQDPARPEDARRTTTADLNNDGFVTLDEVVAMDEAGLIDDEIIRRLEATDFVFELTEHQEQWLMDRGVSRRVVWAMRDINQDAREELLADRNEVISQPRR